MLGWRSLASMAAALALASATHAQTIALKEAPLPGSYFRVEIAMSLAGEVKVQQEGKVVSLKTEAQAKHAFLERVLEAGAGGLAEKTARFYKEAHAVLGTGANRSQRNFRPERTLMVAQRNKDATLTYSPRGPLTREEVELTEHFDTLSLPGLLPGKDTAVGATWQIPNAVAQALADLDGLTGHDLVGKLESAQDDKAVVSVTGTISGIDLGALCKLTIQASATFDRKANRLVALEWKQKDEREPGPVSPAVSFDVTVKLARTPVPAADELSDLALVPVPTTPAPPERLTQISHADPKGRYELAHSRDWQLVGLTDEHLVLRLMDRGDFVAQVTVTPWKKAEPGKHDSGEAFQAAMEKAPGWVQEKELGKQEVPNMGKNWVYRVDAAGELAGVKAVQYHYLVAGPEGDQLVVTFTMTPAQAAKLEARDVNLVRSLVFPTRAEAAPPADGTRNEPATKGPETPPR